MSNVNVERVLFSYIGDTDPVREFHDGPMLHVLRHYKPKKIYLYLTKKMEQIDKDFNPYEKCIRMVDSNVEIIKLSSGIENPSDFEICAVGLKAILKTISNGNPDAEILMNISSGTLQMINALCFEAISGEFRCKTIQVLTPKKDSNAGTQHEHSFSDIELLMEMNLDQIREMEENRCKEVDLAIYQRNRILAQFKTLIAEYEYEAAKVIMNNFPSFFDERKRLLVNHATLRFRLDAGKAEATAREIRDLYGLELYPIKNSMANRITEYFMIASIRQKTGNLEDFILRVTPLLLNLSAAFLDERFKLGRNEITNPNQTPPFIYGAKLKSRYEELPDYLNSKMKTVDRWMFTSSSLLCILDFFKENGKIDEEDRIIIERLEQLRQIEIAARNLTAHEMHRVTEEELKQDENIGISTKEIADLIRLIIIGIFKGHIKKESFDTYEIINKELNK